MSGVQYYRETLMQGRFCAEKPLNSSLFNAGTPIILPVPEKFRRRWSLVRIYKTHPGGAEGKGIRAIQERLLRALRLSGRNTSCVSKLTLSYDFVFLALFRMALTGEHGRIEKRRCLAHPAKKRGVLVGAPELDYCARVSALLTYWKLRDDISDERGSKRLSARALLPAAYSMRKKALRAGSPDINALDALISDKLSALAELESARTYSPDAAADIFGELMTAVSSYGFDGADARIAAEIGRHLGRFIYILDAADDLPDDLERGRYNPFRLDGKPDGETLAEFEKRRPALKVSLTMELDGLSRAVELIDKEPDFLEIIRNIIYLGLPARANETICRREDSLEN